MSVFLPESKVAIGDRIHIWQQVTLAHLLLLLIASAAAILRFTALEALPLSPDEAERALTVWRFWQPGADTPLFDASPAYVNLTFFLPLLGQGDAVMRLVPALFGTILVCLPWLWRSQIGTIGALVTGLLLALSPTASIIALTAGGDAIALVATLLLLISWTRYQLDGQASWLGLTFAALGLGLASGPLFYSGLATLLVAWLLQTRIGPAFTETPSLDGRRVTQTQLLQAALFGAVVFVAIATMFLWRPAGLGAAATQFTEWLAQFSWQGQPDLLLAPFLALGRYELLVLTLGAGAIIWAVWQARPLQLFLVFWFSAGLLLVMLQRGVVENVLLLVLPAYLLIALLVEELFDRPPSLASVGVTGMLLLLGVITYFNGARYIRVATYDSGRITFLFLSLIAILFAVVLLNFVRTWDVDAARQGAVAATLGLFLIFNWGTAWWLTHHSGNDPREQWVSLATDDGVLHLANVVEEISWQTGGAARDISLLSAVDRPVLRWYLRHFETAQFGDVIPPGSQQTAIITPTGTDPALASDYFGADFGLLRTGVASTGPPGTSISELLRWWFFREQPGTVNKERVILWVRSDTLP